MVLDDGRGNRWEVVDKRNLTVYYSIQRPSQPRDEGSAIVVPTKLQNNTSDEAELSCEFRKIYTYKVLRILPAYRVIEIEGRTFGAAPISPWGVALLRMECGQPKIARFHIS
jgi:hypothetical protein